MFIDRARQRRLVLGKGLRVEWVSFISSRTEFLLLFVSAFYLNSGYIPRQICWANHENSTEHNSLERKMARIPGRPRVSRFDSLLDATIAHVERLRDEGVSHLSVDPELVKALVVQDKPEQSAPSKQPVADFKKALKVEPVNVPEPESASSPSQPAIQEPEMSSEEKTAAIQHVLERASVCTKCPNLVRSRKNVVFGVGTVDAKLMFVGEAPGVDEDAQGEPFVGKAGQLLTRIIQTMGLSREEVYIGNVLKCRPDTPGRRYGNRKPTPQEMVTCRPYLMEQIRIIRPRVLVALGATAVEGLLGMSSVGITRYRGTFRDFGGIPLMPTYHPSYVLRNQSHRIKRQIWEDMLQVMEHLGMEISEKQRGYFSKA